MNARKAAPGFKAVMRFPDGARIEVQGPSTASGLVSCFTSISDEKEREALLAQLQARHEKIIQWTKELGGKA